MLEYVGHPNLIEITLKLAEFCAMVNGILRSKAEN